MRLIQDDKRKLLEKHKDPLYTVFEKSLKKVLLKLFNLFF